MAASIGDGRSVIRQHFSIRRERLQVRAAARAGDRLGMEPPVAGIRVFAAHSAQSGKAANEVRARS
jgi:hypothetical protein